MHSLFCTAKCFLFLIININISIDINLIFNFLDINPTWRKNGISMEIEISGDTYAPSKIICDPLH